MRSFYIYSNSPTGHSKRNPETPPNPKLKRRRKENRVGVAVREKIKGSNIWWVFTRHAGERVSELVGDKDIAEDAAEDLRRKIRLGKYDIAAVKAARAAEAKKKNKQTVEKYYEKTFAPLYLETAVAASTAASYANNFKTHIN